MIRNILKNLASSLGVGIMRTKWLDKLQHELQIAENDRDELFDLVLNSSGCKYASYAQNYQDIIVLLATGFKRGGFFVEFGATNGIDLSNTYLLEKNYGWSGILAEPAKTWHDALSKNRDAILDFSCVWSKSNEILKFRMVDRAELSTIDHFANDDFHARARDKCVIYGVKTISLEDLLSKHNAPRQIDYLSIDTEGSEFEILKNFDFTKHEIGVISCEHNHTPHRQKIYDLLTLNGFTRKLTSLSKCDDWYFNESLLNSVELG